jgi:U3 small nucleolar RNA-associated protein 21
VSKLCLAQHGYFGYVLTLQFVIFVLVVTFSSPPTSLTLSPTGEFLATSHVGRLGISLWCDKSFFRVVHLDGTPTEPSKMNEPCPVAECEQEGSSDAALHTFLASSVKKDVITAGDGSTNDEIGDVTPTAKEVGLITLSGLPPAHWKNLFHLELVKERNKPTEAPQKPPQAPFFLQWKAGLDSGTADGIGQADRGTEATKKESDKATTDEWDAVWSDDDDDNNDDNKSTEDTHEVQSSQNQDLGIQNKRRKVVHDRSHLAELLQSCSSEGSYSVVTQYLSKMGPSSIDVELSSLCYGIHDLGEGLPLLHLAANWLLEACKSHESFEAVNAYLHRFLHVHGNVIAAIENGNQEGSEEWNGNDLHNLKLSQFKDTLSQLREEQRAASNRLQGKMQHTICLLRHLSRMV